MTLSTTPPAPLRVLITGSATGIGRATAELLHERGHHVIATARDVPSEVAASQRLTLDVTRPDSVAEACAAAGEVDVLVNNAGRGMVTPIELASPDALSELWATNVLGPVQMIQALLPSMRERRSGRIVNISSVAGRRASCFVGHYAATKHALEAISEALRIELAEFGVDVAVVEPGAVATPFSQNRLGGGDFGPYADLAARSNPWARASNAPAQTAEEVAAVVVEAIEAPGRVRLRWPTSPEVARMIDDRQSRTFEEFETWTLEGIASTVASS